MSSPNPLRQLITVVMNILILVAVLLVVRIVIEFWGALAAQAWADAIITITDYLVVPFGVEPIKTPYGGVFDVDAALTVGALLLAEWALAIGRNRA